MSNNNNIAIGKEKPNLVETPNPPTPPTKVISKTASKIEIEKEKAKEKENITIPKYQYDELCSQVSNLTKLLIQCKSDLSIIHDALTLTQSNVVKTKSSIRV